MGNKNDVKERGKKEETASSQNVFRLLQVYQFQSPTLSLAERLLNANLGQISLGLLSSSPLCHTFFYLVGCFLLSPTVLTPSFDACQASFIVFFGHQSLPTTLKGNDVTIGQQMAYSSK